MLCAGTSRRVTGSAFHTAGAAKLKALSEIDNCVRGVSIGEGLGEMSVGLVPECVASRGPVGNEGIGG